MEKEDENIYIFLKRKKESEWVKKEGFDTKCNSEFIRQPKILNNNHIVSIMYNAVINQVISLYFQESVCVCVYVYAIEHRTVFNKIHYNSVGWATLLIAASLADICFQFRKCVSKSKWKMKKKTKQKNKSYWMHIINIQASRTTHSRCETTYKKNFKFSVHSSMNDFHSFWSNGEKTIFIE